MKYKETCKMARKDKAPYSMSEEEWEEFLDAERIFFKLQEDEKEFVNWVIDGASNKRFELKKTGLQELLRLYEQETGASLERLKE